MGNVSNPKNDSKVWKSGPNVKHRTKTMQGCIVCTSDHKTMHDDGLDTEKPKRKSYFVEKERRGI